MATQLGRLPVLSLLKVGIGSQSHVRVGVAGPTRDGSPVHAAGDQLGNHEGAQVVQAGTHAQLGR
jgi:hypothetical protein